MKNYSTNLEAHTKRRIDTPTMSNSITVEIHGSPDIRRAPQLEIDSLARLVLGLYIES